MVSLHLFSPDGVRWRASPTPPYTNRIPWTDGSTSLVATRERPKLLLGRDGWPTHLISAVPEIGPTACGEKVRSPTAYLAGKRVDITMASMLSGPGQLQGRRPRLHASPAARQPNTTVSAGE